jgi:PAS domain S-box-containing protein
LVFSIQPLYNHPKNIIGVIVSIQPFVLSNGDVDPETPPSDFISKQNLPLHEELLESMPEGIFTINTRWRVATFNRQAEKITGFRREEVIGRNCWEIFRSDMCHTGCPLQIALETGRTAMDQDVRILNKGGSHLTILVNTGVLRDADGLIAGAVETFRPLIGEICHSEHLKEGYSFSDIVGKSRAMQHIFSMLPNIADSDANVLITGESGTGKDLIARAIHNHSCRSNKPFVAVNCSALAETLLESELFGHEKSAFTGATHHKTGRFEMAKGGSLFLDEIGELKPELQIKLLRVLESREFERVGGNQTLPMEARIISATNRDLRQAIVDGKFRKDFYYRLRTVPIAVPPLRERMDDMPILIEYFIKRFNARFDKRVLSIDPEVMQKFKKYHWPGNVRELERTLEHAYVFVKGPVIRAHDLPAPEEFQSLTSESPGPEYGTTKRTSMESIRWALSRTGGNRKRAAKVLGISRTTLWRHMKKFGMVN